MYAALALLLALLTPSPSPSPAPTPANAVDASADLSLISPIRTYSVQGAYLASSYGPGNARASTVIPRLASFYVGKYLMRVTLPRLQTINHVDSAYGDLQLFYLFETDLRQRGRYFGIFAQLPTGVGPITTSKWLLGPAFAYIASFKPRSRTIGVLLQTAFSVAGPRSAKNQSAISVLPFATFQLPHGWFLKTPESPWIFDLQTGSTLIPLGIGIGHRASLDGVPFLIGISDEAELIHANAPRAPKNTIRLTATFIMARP